MYKTFIRTFMLLIVLIFGGITAAHASITDTNQSTDGDRQNQIQWNKQNIYHFMKTFYIKWDNHWKSGKYQKHFSKYQPSSKPSKENNGQSEQTEQVNQPAEEKQLEKENKQLTKQPSKPEQAEQPLKQPETENKQPEIENKQPTVEQPENPSESTDSLNNFEQQVFELTNQERVKAGLAALKIDHELSRVAREKSRDMAINNYFSHNSPVYGSPFDMIRAYGINYRSAGENIAKGQRTPQEVVNAWMNSPGHRANIMNGSFTHIGVGFVEQGNHWTQMFIGR